jgi:medium-chain acyl-[acyl-carrier-protein] hydrolase
MLAQSSEQNSEHSKLLVCCKKNPRATVNLFCFPYSGAGPAVFRRWVTALPEFVEVWALQLPGREARHAEAMNARLYQIIEEAAAQITAINAQISGSPRAFAFYGHSLGAYLAYCTALQMQKTSPECQLPSALFLSGRRSPDQVVDEPLATLTDAALVKRLTEMGGISAEFAAEPEFIRLALPKLRYDLSLNEAPLPVELRTVEPKIATPLWIYRGANDCQAPEPEVRSWQNFTALKCEYSVLPGDHFFVVNNSRIFLHKFFCDLEAVFSI